MGEENERVENGEMTAAAVIDEQAPVTPVRSAKDAINAMYANGGKSRLSDYLASSAKEIINANSRPASDTKSAANLHRNSTRNRLEYEQPSASSILRTAAGKPAAVPSDVSSAMDPLARRTATPRRPAVRQQTTQATYVVKSSLKLGPKRTPVVSSPQNVRPNRVRSMEGVNNRKGATNLEKLLASRKQQMETPDNADTIKINSQSAKTQAVGTDVHARRTRAGSMQDIVRPASAQRASAGQGINVNINNSSATRPASRPLDSIKRRFRAAPKGYAQAEPELQAESYTADYAVETAEPLKKRPAIEIYGLMDDEPAKKPDSLTEARYGVVEDYHGSITEQKIAQGSGNAAPDNNKYSIKGQSPFFLKSVNVEKRPLSDTPTKKQKNKNKDVSGTLYEQPDKEPVSRKNVYQEKETAKAKKDLPTKPTVIIPSARRSKAPMICLLILTVVLGAAVGMFIYLFLHDMEMV